MRTARKKRRIGRPPAPEGARRPVLAARVEPAFLELLKRSATASGRNVSAELIWRARESYNLEAGIENARAFVDEVRREVQEDRKASIETVLTELGYTKVPAPHGTAWFEPGVDPVQWIFSHIDPGRHVVLQEMLDRAAIRAIEKMRGHS